MKKVVAVSALFLLCSLLYISKAVAAAPELTAEKREINFGEVVQGGKVERTFSFRNRGDAELVISQVRSSCGCTAALLSADRIPPGGKGELRAAFDSGNFRGGVSKTIFLHSNDPRHPVMEFTLRGTVRPQIELTPEQVDLGTIAPGGSKDVKVTLVNRTKREIVLSPPRSTAPEIQVRMASGPLRPGESRILTVKGVPGADRNGVSGYVLLNASGASVPELRLPVYGVVRSR